MNKTKWYNNHFYFIFFSLLIVVYNFVVTAELRPTQLSDVCYPYFLVDFSMGFCSKLLPGAIYNFFFDNTSRVAVFTYNTVIFIAFMLIISIMLEKLMLKTEEKYRTSMFFLSILFLTGISIFPMCVYKMASLDSYWMYFTVLSMIFLSNKKLYLLIIPASLMIIMVNFGALIVYIPFIVLLMIYKTTIIQDKKEKNFLWFVIIASAIFSVLLSMYFLIYEQSNLVYTFEEFTRILNDRGYEGASKYYATGLYSEPYYETVDYDHINSIESPFLRAIVFVFYRVLLTLEIIDIEKGIAPILLCLPVAILIFYFFKQLIKRENICITKKFVLFCMSAMFFITIILSTVFSSDMVRFIGHAYTLLMASFFYVVYYEGNNSLVFVENWLSKIPKTLVLLHFVCYFFMVFDPEG